MLMCIQRSSLFIVLIYFSIFLTKNKYGLTNKKNVFIYSQIAYFKHRKEEDFVRILEHSRTEADTNYKDSDKDQVPHSLSKISRFK